MGSHAYGTADTTDTSQKSDFDIYGYCFAPKFFTFPWLSGEILNFDKQVNRFDQWQSQHIFDKDALGGLGREYDFSVFNIIKYFRLLTENNINVIDSLFVPFECILHCTSVGNQVREKRKIFLHKGVWHKVKGYSFSQLTR